MGAAARPALAARAVGQRDQRDVALARRRSPPRRGRSGRPATSRRSWSRPGTSGCSGRDSRPVAIRAHAQLAGVEEAVDVGQLQAGVVERADRDLGVDLGDRLVRDDRGPGARTPPTMNALPLMLMASLQPPPSPLRAQERSAGRYPSRARGQGLGRQLVRPSERETRRPPPRARSVDRSTRAAGSPGR